MVRVVSLFALCGAVLLAACGSAPKSPSSTSRPQPGAVPSGAPGAPAAQAAPADPAPPAVTPQLAAEQRWLEDLFKGTPVVISPGGPGPNAPLRVEVPLRYSFDEGRSVVKPPLGAVLDRVAASLSRQPRARVGVAAPSDGNTASVRGQLVAKGVQAYRIEKLPNRPDMVELRLQVVSAGIDKLEDPPAITKR